MVLPFIDVSLNAIHIEVGGSTGTSISLNDADVRGLANPDTTYNEGSSGLGSSGEFIAVGEFRNGFENLVDFANDVTYYVRTGTTTGSYCVYNTCSIEANIATSGCAVTFFFKLNGTTVEFYVDPDHTIRYSPTQPGQITSLTESAHYKNTSGTTVSFSGNHSSGFTPIKIAQFDTGTVGNRQARISSTVISGSGTNPASVSGYTIGDGGTNDTGWRTPHATTLYGIAPGALTLLASGGSTTSATPYHRLTMEVKATGYNTEVLSKFVSWQSAVAISDDDNGDPPL